MEDLEEIKKIVSERPLPQPLASRPLPHEIIDLERMVEETPKIAPLFVKLEKYKEIIASIKELKSAVNGIKSLMTFKRQLEVMNSETDEVLFKILQRFGESVNQFSMDFAIPRGVSYIPRPLQAEKVDESVSDLGERIAKLREELDKIKL